MSVVTIYTRPMCGYCARALKLLRKKEVDFEEIEAGFDAEKKAEMVQRSGGRTTFPQIFVGDRHIGGCDELQDLEWDGKLDPLLAEAGGR
ncbi:MAG: glutaredoxin 3 [Pseudomonadota bacterium]